MGNPVRTTRTGTIDIRSVRIQTSLESDKYVGRPLGSAAASTVRGTSAVSKHDTARNGSAHNRRARNGGVRHLDSRPRDPSSVGSALCRGLARASRPVIYLYR